MVWHDFYKSLNFLIKNNDKQEQRYTKNIVYEGVFNNLLKIQQLSCYKIIIFYLGVNILNLIVIIPIQFIPFVIITTNM